MMIETLSRLRRICDDFDGEFAEIDRIIQENPSIAGHEHFERTAQIRQKLGAEIITALAFEKMKEVRERDEKWRYSDTTEPYEAELLQFQVRSHDKSAIEYTIEGKCKLT